jgi:hypothetical protein
MELIVTSVVINRYELIRSLTTEEIAKLEDGKEITEIIDLANNKLKPVSESIVSMIYGGSWQEFSERKELVPKGIGYVL